MKNRILYFLIVVFFLSACEAPTARYLDKGDGLWNIDELHYVSEKHDTTFTNCGEMSFIKKTDLDGKKDKDWEVEGSIEEVANTTINNQDKWIWSSWHFYGNVRDHFLAAGSKIYISLAEEIEVKVKSRTSKKMVWEFTHGDPAITYTYKFSRK